MRRRRALALGAALALAFVGGVPAAGDTPSPTGPQFRTAVPSANFPTNVVFPPDGRVFYTEKETGRIRIVQGNKILPEPFATLPVQGGGESGLLGLALDPNFATQPYVYVYYTSSQDGRNHLARIRESVNLDVTGEISGGDPNIGGPPENLLTLLTASGIHNGGDIAFGADGKLYVVVGETGDDALAQDPTSLGGKVLRLNPDGSIPPDNPFGPNSPVYSMGHRNSFGLCVNPHDGDLWETENGPDRDDEINRIQAGGNYGWPEHLGPVGKADFVDPALTFSTVIVPTGCAFYDHAISAGGVEPPPGGQLVFGDFHGDLHSVLLEPPAFHDVRRETVEAHLPAGITDVEVGPDGDLYVATENSIVRIEPAHGVPFSPGGPQSPSPSTAPPESSGGLSTGAIVLIVAAVVLAVDGVIVVVARRRRRRHTTPPG